MAARLAFESVRCSCMFSQARWHPWHVKPAGLMQQKSVVDAGMHARTIIYVLSRAAPCAPLCHPVLQCKAMPLSAEVEGQVAALIKGSKNDEFLARNVKETFSILRRNSLLTTIRIPPMAVGVHPQNRDGAALVTQDVHELRSV